MNSLSLADEFGTHLANGEAAAAFRAQKIDPIVESKQKLVLDFSHVRSANSSFMNALISGIVENRGPSVLESIVFKGCNPVVRVLVEAAIDLGMQKVASKAA
jgi:hypothetical protein